MLLVGWLVRTTHLTLVCSNFEEECSRCRRHSFSSFRFVNYKARYRDLYLVFTNTVSLPFSHSRHSIHGNEYTIRVADRLERLQTRLTAIKAQARVIVYISRHKILQNYIKIWYNVLTKLQKHPKISTCITMECQVTRYLVDSPLHGRITRVSHEKRYLFLVGCMHSRARKEGGEREREGKKERKGASCNVHGGSERSLFSPPTVA